MLIAVLIMTAVAKAAPRAIADVVASLRASKAGEWDFLDRERDRRQAAAVRRAGYAGRVASAWAARRQARSVQAGGSGVYRPGFKAYLGDVYHGVWEDRIERRQARRAARPAYDPTAPTLVDQAVARVAEGIRAHRAKRLDGEDVEPGEVTPTVEPDPAPEQASEQVAEPAAVEPATPDEAAMTPEPASAQPLVAGAPFAHAPTLAIVPQITEQPTTNGGDMTTSTTTAAVATEVNTNEEARRAFTEMSEAAAQLQEALVQAEAARARISAAGQATADSMTAKQFDAVATAAAQEVTDTIGLGTLAQWAEAADAVGNAAKHGLASLEKYRDAEDLVAGERIDASTLDASAS
jgi:hypothetical protein